MKKFYTALVLVACFFQLTCKNPLSGVKLYVRNSYYNYTVTLSLKDALHPNTNITNAQISVSGPNGTNIYDRDGKKSFKIDANGCVDFSVIPTTEPTNTSPITFTINICGANGSTYLPVSKIVTIYPKQAKQRFTVRMIDKNNPPTGVKVGSRTISMSNGGLSKPGYSGSRITGGAPFGGTDDSLELHDLSIFIADGTHFYFYKDDAGQITGTRPSLMTHDSTATYGAMPVLYRPTTDYYTEESALIPSTYTQAPFAGNYVDIVYLYQPDVAPEYSIYTYGSIANTISGVNISGQAENAILFGTAAKKRLIAIYFVGHQMDGTQICVSPMLPSNYPDSMNWYLSYRIDPTLTNPKTTLPYAAGDKVETGIDYTSGTYPIVPVGSTFTPGSLNTQTARIRQTVDGDLRVECLSTDVGMYVKGNNATFDFNFDATNDTNNVPDPENLYANASIAINVGTTTTYFNYIIVPNENIDFSGCVTGPLGTPLNTTGSSFNVFYWDSLVNANVPIDGRGRTISVFDPTNFITTTTYGPDVVRFYYTFLCAASGTPRIVEPTFNSTIHGYTTNGIDHKVNCNVVAGYWATRGFHIGDSSGALIGDACGTPFNFPSVTLSNFNYKQIDNNVICTCYFH